MDKQSPDSSIYQGMGRKQQPVRVEVGEAGAMLLLTAAFIHRTIQDLINMRRCCPWQVVPRQDISREANRRGRKRGKEREREVKEEGGQERRGQQKEGRALRAAHCFSIILRVLPPSGFPNKFLIAATFYFSPGCWEVTALL